MLKQVGTLLCCGALLSACSSIMGAPDPRPPDPAPQPLPAVKQILANSTDVLFAPTANPKNVAISDLRRALQRFPRQGDREPWINSQMYARDARMIRGALEDGALIFNNRASRDTASVIGAPAAIGLG